MFKKITMESTPLSSCNESTLTPYTDSGENPWNTIKIKQEGRHRFNIREKIQNRLSYG